MISRKMMMTFVVIVLIIVNVILLTVTNRRHRPEGVESLSISLVAPFQTVVSKTICFLRDTWRHYFFIVSVAEENDRLRKELSIALEKSNRCYEIELANRRLFNKKDFNREVLAAEVIGRDSSPWFKTVIINKGRRDGIEKGFPVILPEGLVGQVIRVSGKYAKVLLLIDWNSAVDGLVQRTRARGIIKGKAMNQCLFKYALRKKDIQLGDIVISSGLDGIFPKGLRLGYVSNIVREKSGVFQEVSVTTFINFESIEEVMVVMNSPANDFPQEP
jgi:rod shape-determining protein MreC